MDVAFHANPALDHQRQHAEWFRRGLGKCGHRLRVTADRDAEADIHIVSGPWYAKSRWIGHPRVVLIDRCYYRGDPQHVSVGWMNAAGGRDFTAGEGRPGPVPAPAKVGTRSIFLADYEGPVEPADTVRLHPARERPGEPLEAALSRHDVAIGYDTTALVTAALMGLRTVCRSETNIMARPDWLELLPWADWHGSEIASGACWDHLRQAI